MLSLVNGRKLKCLAGAALNAGAASGWGKGNPMTPSQREAYEKGRDDAEREAAPLFTIIDVFGFKEFVPNSDDTSLASWPDDERQAYLWGYNDVLGNQTDR